MEATIPMEVTFLFLSPELHLSRPENGVPIGCAGHTSSGEDNPNQPVLLRDSGR